jgi:ketosteroid isomerase-like protein
VSHVESSRAAYEAFSRGDIEAAFADLRDDAVFHGNSQGLPAGGDYRGREEILGKWLPELAAFEGMEVGPSRFLDAGDHVIVMGDQSATVAGQRLDGTFCHVWRYDGDKVAEAWFFEDSAQTLRAMESAKAGATS